MIKQMLSKVLVAGAVVLAVATPAAAQTRISNDAASVGVGVVLLKWADFDSTAKGIGIDFSKPIVLAGKPNFSIVGDVTFAKDDGETDTTFGGGVRYTVASNSKMKVHVQALLGIARWSVPGFSDSGFFIAPGFGVLYPITDKVDFKGQVDFFLVNWDDGNLYRVFLGVAFKLGQK